MNVPQKIYTEMETTRAKTPSCAETRSRSHAACRE